MQMISWTRLVHAFCWLGSLALLAAPIDWKQAEKVQAGTRMVQLEKTVSYQDKDGTRKQRPLKAVMFRVNLRTPGLRFTGTGRDVDWGKPMPDHHPAPPRRPWTIRTKRVPTLEFMKECRLPKEQGGRGLAMIVACNSAPWGPWEAPFTFKYGEPHGLQISDGVVVRESDSRNLAIFVVWKNGTVDIVSGIPRERWPEVSLAHSGFAILMKDGNRLSVGGYEGVLHPRMAWGLSADRHYLYLLAVDGRQPQWSLGADGRDICDIMEDAGASDVVNMDGGGSTTLCYWDEGKGVPVVVNHAVANPAKYHRPNAMNMGIWLQPAEDGAERAGEASR